MVQLDLRRKQAELRAFHTVTDYYRRRQWSEAAAIILQGVIVASGLWREEVEVGTVLTWLGDVQSGDAEIETKVEKGELKRVAQEMGTMLREALDLA